MGAKFKEVNTLSFIGNIGPKTERVWKEVDEEIDIIGCKDKFDRPCQLIAPLNLLEKDLPGDRDTKQIPVFINDNVRIELMHCRASKDTDGRGPAGFCETQIQVRNKRVTKTSEGDFELAEGDVLVVPPNVSHANQGDGPATRLIVYTRSAFRSPKPIPSRKASYRTNSARC
jgi:hypothetical protein